MSQEKQTLEMHSRAALTEDVQTTDDCDQPITLNKGAVGFVVNIFQEGESYAVDFCGEDDRSIATVVLKAAQLERSAMHTVAVTDQW